METKSRWKTAKNSCINYWYVQWISKRCIDTFSLPVIHAQPLGSWKSLELVSWQVLKDTTISVRCLPCEFEKYKPHAFLVFFNYLVLSHRREHACNFFYQSVCQLLYHEHFTGQVSANQLVTVTNTFFFLFRVVQTLSHNFRNATRIVRVPLRLPIGSHQVLVKVIYAGVNASDVSSRFPKEFTLIYIFFFGH